MNWLFLTLLLVGAPPHPTASPCSEADVLATGRELRCPVCQGMPIAESPSEMAQAMMQRVCELHHEGKSKEEILQYFVARYGEWVLLRPPTHGFSLLVWILPPLAFVLGLLGIALRLHREKRTSDVEPSPTRSNATDVERARQTLEKGDE